MQIHLQKANATLITCIDCPGVAKRDVASSRVRDEIMAGRYR